jgi:hypothetical protein
MAADSNATATSALIALPVSIVWVIVWAGTGADEPDRPVLTDDGDVPAAAA